MNYHQRLFGQVESILASLPPSALKSLRGTQRSLPASARIPLWRARSSSSDWIHEDDLAWIACAWARYRTDPGDAHASASIAAVGAALGIRGSHMAPLWSVPWPQPPCRTAIEEILKAARAADHPVCFARLAWDLTWLRANRTVNAAGRTRAERVRQQWQTDAACTDPERNPEEP